MCKRQKIPGEILEVFYFEIFVLTSGITRGTFKSKTSVSLAFLIIVQFGALGEIPEGSFGETFETTFAVYLQVFWSYFRMQR